MISNNGSKTWAVELRNRYLAGEVIQACPAGLAQAALNEKWKVEGGKRVCVPSEPGEKGGVA